MIPRERVLAALDRKPVDRVPFVEISVAFEFLKNFWVADFPRIHPAIASYEDQDSRRRQSLVEADSPRPHHVSPIRTHLF